MLFEWVCPCCKSDVVSQYRFGWLVTCDICGMQFDVELDEKGCPQKVG